MSNSNHWAGEICSKTGTYGQYHDTNNAYAGHEYDRLVKKGDKFPPSQNNYHYQEK